MKSISLNGVWNLRGKEEGVCDTPVISIPATVPGCVQLDLSENGYLPKDLYMGENILQAEKYEDYEWWYETTFGHCTSIVESQICLCTTCDCSLEISKFNLCI